MRCLKSNFNFKINVIDSERSNEVKEQKVEDHPLLQSAIESFNGKLI